MMESRSRGVLDTPLEPVIGLSEGETRWRGMTVIARSDLSAAAQRAKAEATKQSILSSRRDGLLRTACHRARIRATRSLAMRVLAELSLAV
jgi:RNA polymerase subunit RPABC4/transcription elongation factor Spt4